MKGRHPVRSARVSRRLSDRSRRTPPSEPLDRSSARNFLHPNRLLLKRDKTTPSRSGILADIEGRTLRPFWRCVHTCHRWNYSSLSTRSETGRALKTVPAHVTDRLRVRWSVPACLREARFAVVCCPYGNRPLAGKIQPVAVCRGLCSGLLIRRLAAPAGWLVFGGRPRRQRLKHAVRQVVPPRPLSRERHGLERRVLPPQPQEVNASSSWIREMSSPVSAPSSAGLKGFKQSIMRHASTILRAAAQVKGRRCQNKRRLRRAGHHPRARPTDIDASLKLLAGGSWHRPVRGSRRYAVNWGRPPG